MTKHYCDKCGKECNWLDMVRIAADKDKPCGIGIHKLYELCEECYQKIFVAKESEDKE